MFNGDWMNSRSDCAFAVWTSSPPQKGCSSDQKCDFRRTICCVFCMMFEWDSRMASFGLGIEIVSGLKFPTKVPCAACVLESRVHRADAAPFFFQSLSPSNPFGHTNFLRHESAQQASTVGSIACFTTRIALGVNARSFRPYRWPTSVLDR
jgi:hypothetical protein